jgi:Fe-S-cluster containining protein
MEKLRQEELDIPIPSLCTRCSKCCLNDSYMCTLSIDRTDIARWRKQRRADILQHVWSITPTEHDAWVKPDGSECTRCPFVRKDAGAATYKCRIYDTRPQVCRDYIHRAMHRWNSSAAKLSMSCASGALMQRDGRKPLRPSHGRQGPRW